MQIGYYGLGKMGANMVELLLEKKHDIIASNRSKEPIDEIAKKGATPAYDLEGLVKKVKKPRTIWLMVPHDAVDTVLTDIMPLLAPGDTIIDGGNSLYKESIRRGKDLEKNEINFLDAGVSGGPDGARNGACVMVGGKKELFDKYEDIFRDISAKDAYGYMGKSGAGHFVKMVHNGIEYGMMQAIGEGFALMNVPSDFDLDLKEISRIYNHQSVITSRLTDWLEKAYVQEGVALENISGEVSHSGEGQWTVDAAKEMDIPVTVIEAALEFRKMSQGNPSYTGKVVSALRGQFGGHEVKN
ncbi:6-phosphogluconate dehydrogenase (decarboxylating) [bacterium]|jgi:6-phosphogluconate dehydrogenase|nr:6-phosphogluconate dehydrogenase (decarboxylating) [bacterium]MDP6571577.1 decarboxylating 6-phosphogluconate dehydrogenase [Patescibacteria group bacterium]MDP6756091.1 decarboxylating 6-phosphogluconate dehydrogenase [Patescibacteria group bacterium]|tara:strand:+ start:1400 stop:2296 length:897 start_codon:yes stop_codon:yes gene_type:complete